MERTSPNLRLRGLVTNSNYNQVANASADIGMSRNRNAKHPLEAQ